MTNHRTTFVKTLQFVEAQVSSPLSVELLELCESDLFQELLQNSENASSSNRCYEEQLLYTVYPSIPPYCPTGMDNTTTSSTAVTTSTIPNFSMMFEDKITPLNLTNTSRFPNNQYPFSNQDQHDLSLLQNQNQNNDPIFLYPNAIPNDHVTGPTTLLNVCEEDLISPMPTSKFMLPDNMLSSNYPFNDPSMNSNLLISTERGNLFSENDIQLKLQGDNNGIFCTDHLPHSFKSNELQAFSNESQHLVNEGASSTIPLAPEITSLEPESLRVTSKLTSKERKEKINKYMKKRNERNFNKKIKYACRKTLADNRPRVRGRFAKYEDFGESNRTNSNHEEDTDEDEWYYYLHEVAKEEEEEDFESSDIVTHISGINSFKCNYSIQSWI